LSFLLISNAKTAISAIIQLFSRDEKIMSSYKTWLYPILFLTVLTLGACGGGGSSAPAVDTTPPVFSSMAPANQSPAASINTSITVTFNETLQQNCTAATFVLTPPASGTHECSGTSITFTPNPALAPFTTYSIAVNGVADIAGNLQTTPVTKSFTTGAAPDLTRPTVSSTTPATDAPEVALNVKPTATFDEALAPATVTNTSFTLRAGSTTIPGTVIYDAGTLTATFTPNVQLAIGTVYTATLSTVIKDLAGNALAAAYTWSFTTVATDTAPPEVVSTSPVNNSNFVSSRPTITAVFNEALAAPVSAETFALVGADGDIAGTVSYNPSTRTATFTPAAQLPIGPYTATLSSDITDSVGNPLTEFSWVFTVNAPALTAAPSFTVGNGIPGDPVELKLKITPGAYKITVCLAPRPTSPTPARLAVGTVEPGLCSNPNPIVNNTGASEIDITVNIPANAIFADYFPQVTLTEAGEVTPLRSYYDYLPANSPTFYGVYSGFTGSGLGTPVLTNIVVPFLVVGPAPDLQSTIASATLVGTNLTIAFTVKNIGVGAAGAANIDFFVNAATAPVVGQSGGVRVSVPALPVDGIFTSSVVVPNVTAAPSVVYALVDSTSVVAESNESNNVATRVNLNAPLKSSNNTDGVQAIASPGFLESTLQVSSTINALRYVAVELNITHTYDEDLTLTLISPPAPGFPNGKSVILSNQRGGSGDNYSNTLFHDGAVTTIAAGNAPFAGEFTPESPLAVLNGENPNGTWTLKVVDSNTFDLGTLNSWSLRFW
jgi:subtilisin-like proprotein convertase family protein/methionine-rich copper-binding protein CopC